MIPETTDHPVRRQPRARRAAARSAQSSRNRRKTFKQAVPSAVRARLDEVLRKEGRSPERLKELYESHALDSEFGATFLQFRRFANGVTNRASEPETPAEVAGDGEDARLSPRSTNSKGTDTRAPRPVTTPGTTSLGREAFHQRMKAIGEIVDSTFGALATHQPDLWGHGAYLMLVGSVVACLAERHAELSTSELATLSKILAEQRSLTLKQAEADRKLADRRSKAAAEHSSVDAAGNGDAQPRKLPAHFGDVVRQIYGTSFQDDFTVPSEGNAAGTDDPPGAAGGSSTSAGVPGSPGKTLVGKPPSAPDTVYHE